MLLKKWIGSFGVFLLLIIIFASIYVTSEGDHEMEKEVKKEAITYIAKLHERDEENITVEEVHFSNDYLSFSVNLLDSSFDKSYEVAVILNEQETEINLVIDVTGAYDKYGSAYCH